MLGIFPMNYFGMTLVSMLSEKVFTHMPCYIYMGSINSIVW